MQSRPSRLFPTSTKRRALLAGTALVSTLLWGLLAPSPATALDQNFIEVQAIPLVQIELLFNNSKLNTTLGTDINTVAFSPFNLLAGGNTNNANVGNLNQLIDVTQTGILENFIDITNSGEIDPAIGIFAQINNSALDLFNNAALSNINGTGAVISLGDLSQLLYLNQTNTVTNTIAINNSAKITADDFGIFAEINNTAIAELFNLTAVSNINGDGAIVSLGDHRQLIDLDQTNTLSNSIDITNSGEIDPAIGIFAGINNTLIASLFNNAAVSNINGAGAILSVGDLIQTIDFDQTNRIDNAITIDNGGAVVADDIGILAEIETVLVASLFNLAAGNNTNGSAAVVTLGGHEQSLEFDQTNVIANNISIDNDAEIDPQTGILAKITNQDLASLFNSAATVNANGAAAVLSAGDLNQSTEQDQANVIASDITIWNSGNVDASQIGIQALITNQSLGSLSNSVGHSNLSGTASAVNFGDFTQTGAFDQANVVANDITVMNDAEIDAGGTGIDAMIDNDTIDFINDATVSNLFDATAGVAGDLTQSMDIEQANILTNNIYIANAGSVRGGDVGISAQILNASLSFSNTVTGTATSGGTVGGGVAQTANVNQTNLVENDITIVNTGKVWGGNLGIFASIPDFTFTAANIDNVTLDAGTPSITESSEAISSILIDNAGDIGADSLFAIDTESASTTIVNRDGGVITGFIDLTDKADLFDNLSGGTFEARMTSDFRGGGDLFQNAGAVHTAENKNMSEHVSFVNLERFENSGLISLHDGRVGDTFTISNTVGGTDLDYAASDGATLGVDAFLGGPGSRADNFIVQGDVSGRTLLQVGNTNPGGGSLNTKGIPVVFVDGDVKKNAFYLDKPIDAGLFDYDLFFVPTGSGFFELRSHAGGGAHVTPRLITVSHDVFHTTTETWFDRTADLRVLLNRGAPLAPNATTATGEPVPTSFVPAVWAKGQGTWLNQKDHAKSRSSGRTYRYDLERDLQVANFEMGIDLGAADVLAQGDMLVFGMLGGAVLANLDYENVVREFEIEGGEVGAYATYLRGGLFVDTLLKAHFLEIDPNEAAGFPSELDTTTWGVRTDAGYRFGSFSHGAFVEPLATIAFAWNEMDDFVINGNRVDFSDETNVRGRLGLRVGTSYEAWAGTLVEPFVIGSLWSNLSGDNHVKLTSKGTTFLFKDEPDDVWGVISGGVNFFNPDAQTSVFAKLDVIVGDETDGLSAKAGMRYNW